MTTLAPTLEAFFCERLMTQRHASPNTIAAYRDTFRLLVTYLHETAGTQPSDLVFETLDAGTIAAFLDHLETDRGVGIATRNARLSAIHSLFRFAAFRHPEHSGLIARVLDIPTKRAQRADISYLDETEVDALLSAPDTTTRRGRRDHALLTVAVQTGLRVSELVGLRRHDVTLGIGAHLTCVGKGRKQRSTPLTAETAHIVKQWLAEQQDDQDAPLFPGPTGGRLTTDAVRRIVRRHATAAAETRPSIASKHVTPHILRHTCAMRLLHAGVDRAVIALWLGHESIRTTDIYQHADLTLKERALARITPGQPRTVPRYQPPDELLTFLVSL